MADKPVRFGVVGTGGWANFVHLATYQAHPKAQIACVCDVDERSAERAAANFGAESVATDYRSMMERDDIDAVSIVTPNVYHADMTLAALAAGKHVMCEKPMAMTYDEAKAMADAASAAGVKTGINFSYRGFPGARYAQHIVSEGHLGRIFHVNAKYLSGGFTNPKVPLIWRMQKAMAGTGALGDIGAHMIDNVTWISGERITSLVADQRTFIDKRPLMDGSGTGSVDVDDATTLMTRFAGGGMGNILITHFASSREVEVEVEIYGETGALIYRLSDPNNIKLAIGPFVKESQMIDAPIPGRFKLSQNQIWRRNVNAFVDALANDTEMKPDFADGLRNQEIQQAAVTSTEEKRWVDFPLGG